MYNSGELVGDAVNKKDVLNSVFNAIKKREIRYINLLFTNLLGRRSVVSIPAADLDDAVRHGVGFDGSSLGFIGVEKSDLLLKPDPSTFTVLPWETNGKTALMIADVYREKEAFELDPRHILKEAVKKLKKMMDGNIEYMIAPEIEFWLFTYKDDRLEFQDKATYFTPPPEDKGYNIRMEVATALESMGIHPVKIHHEVPPAKHEIDIQYGPAVKIADATIIYKFVVKWLSAKHNLIASFMPKPFYGTYGAGMHTHQSLMNVKEKKNLFYGDDENGLSEMMLHFIGGLLSHAKGITLLTNPTVNSYKRLVPGWEAPVYISWARYNRSVLLRVPMTTDPMKIRIEYRATDGSCNPYIAFAAMLLAGLDGIKKAIEPPSPIEENVYKMTAEERSNLGIETLPSSLSEAINEAERETLIKEMLGEKAYEKLINTKKMEWIEYNVMVHEWEREKYLNV